MMAKRMTKRMTKRSVAACCAIVLLALSGHAAGSQPTRTVKIIVSSTPGGGSDILGRLLAEQIARTPGPAIVIENRPGAGTVIGTDAASRAQPDGSTVLITTPEFVIAPHLRKLSYDPLTSFEPICYLVRSPQLIVVNAASPYRSLADLMDAARGRPDELTLASAGPASSPQMAYEMLAHAAGIRMTYVPYPGSAPAVSALLGGHVTSVMAAYPNVAEQVKGGQLRALATASRTRIDSLADVPTLAESGYRDFEADLWYGMVAPARTSPETLSQLAGLFTAALQAPEIKPKLAVQGLYPVGACGADFAAHLRKQYDDYGRIIREANIKAE
jgi:tripartite-type tricarboxylate transporter receptor subunit TctC